MADYLNNAAESAEDKRKRWEAAFEEGRQRVAQGNRYKQYMDEHFGVTDQQRRQAYQSSGMDRMRIDLSALENDIRSGTARTSRVNSMVSAIQKQRAYFQRYADYFTPEELQGFEQELSGHEQILTGEQDRVREAAAQRQTARRSATSHIDLYHRQQQTQQPDLMQRAQTGAALGAPMGRVEMPVDQAQRKQLGILTPQEQRAQAQRGMELRKTYGDSYDVELAAKKKAEAEADARKLYERKKADIDKKEARGWNSQQEKEKAYRELEYLSKRLGAAQAEKMRFSAIQKEYGEKTMEGMTTRMQVVGKEIAASQKRVEQLQKERKKAEVPGGRREGNEWVSFEADTERIAEIDREIKNEQRKQRILEGQQNRIVQDWQTAYFYKFSVLQNREDFEEKSRYAASGDTGRYLALAASETQRNRLLELDNGRIFYDYVNGNADAVKALDTSDRFAVENHTMWKNLPEETVRTFNYLYTTEGKDAALEYLSMTVSPEYTWLQSLNRGIASGTGLASISGAIGTGMASLFGGEDDKKNAIMSYRQWQQDTAGAAQQHPFFYYAGSTVGNLGLMAATGGVAGKVVGAAGGAASGAIGGRVATGALSFATAQAIRDMGEAATGGITAGEYGKNIIVSGIQGAAGNLASELVSSGIANRLIEKNLMTPFMEWMRNTASGVTFATVNQAIGYLAADEKPTAGEIVTGLISSFAFSLLDGGLRTLRTTRAAKQQLEQMVNSVKDQYNALTNNSERLTKEQAAERVAGIYQYTQDVRAKLDGTYLAGQQETVDQMHGALDFVSDWAYNWIAENVNGAASAGTQTAPTGGLGGGMLTLPETAGQGPTMPTQPVTGGTPEQSQQTPEQSQQVQELQQEITQAMTEGLTGSTGMTASGAADVPTQIEAPRAENTIPENGNVLPAAEAAAGDSATTETAPAGIGSGTPGAENVTEIDNEKPEADSAAGIEAGAAADNTLPEAQQTRPAQDIRKEDRNGTRTERLPDRNGGRLAGAGTGGQTGGLGRGRPQGTAQQSRTAIQRQNTARALRLQKVSSRELGLEQGTDEKNLQIFPIGAWDDELKQTVEEAEAESGKHVTVVLGPMQISTRAGLKKVRGVNNEKEIIAQADNYYVTVKQIVDHELAHERLRQNPGLAQDIEREIRQDYTEEEFDRVVDAYISKLRGIVDFHEGMSDREYDEALQRVKNEILCDAYAGINAFGAHAEQYQEQAQRVMQRRGIGRKSKENAAALARRGVGDDGERYSISDSLETDLQKVLDGTFRGDGEVYVGETSNFLTDVIGADALQVTMPSTKAYSAMVTEEQAKAEGRYKKNANYHGLGINGLMNALEASENPVAAFADTGDEKGKRTGNIVLVTDQTGADGNIVVIEAVNAAAHLRGKYIEANKVITTYDRRTLANDIMQAAIDGRLMHLDKKRSHPILAGGPAANSQGTIQAVDFNKNIQDFWSNVKWEKSGKTDYLSGNDGENKTAFARAYEEAQRKKEAQQTKDTYSLDDEDVRFSADEEPAAELEEKPKKRKKTQPVAESLPIIAKRELKQNLLNLFSIPQGMRADLGGYVDHMADKIVKNGALTQEERDEFFDRMYSSGVMEVAADEYYQTARQDIVGRRIYVPEEVKHEFGDDWNQFRRNAFSAGVLLTNQRSDNAIDTLNMELAENLPGLFDANETDSRSILERIVQMADEGRSEQMSLSEYAAWLAGQDYVSEDEVLDNIERQMDWALRTFAEKAGLEIRLRDRTGVKIAQERERTAEARMKAAEARGRYAEKAEVLQQEYDERVEKINDRANAKIKEARDETANARMRAAEQRGRFAVREKELKDHFYDRERKIREREKLKWAEARQHRKEMNQQQRERRELRELQQRTLKQLQWLAKNQQRAPEELRDDWNEVLSDIDIYAVGAANAMNYSNKYGATWENLAEMYKAAKAEDPNFLPSKELERIVARLDNRKIEDMDLSALQDLYKAAVGLRTEFYNRNNVIGDEHNRMFEEVYEDSKRELTAYSETKGAKAARNGGKISKFLNQDQLSPMNVMQRMGGWNPKGTFYTMARQLEKGERDIRAYTVRANKELEDVLTEYADFVRRADGQGKDAIWYEVEVPELMELGMGDKPIFGDTVKVYMTPSQKIHMYLESKNYENLRHMAGGRTFADKKLYSEGKRREAFAQGKTIRLAPETVKALVSNLTPDEQAIADALERYYNQFAKQEINRVSNLLYGYDKAVSKNYTPIYTNTNYTKSEMGVYNATAEGVGNLKQRQYSKNPSYNIGAFDAFERHVEQTARFVGMAVPARNWQTLLNWRESNDSMADVITHSWGDESLRYIQDLVTSLQAGKDGKNDTVSTGVEKFFSNYISAVFGANPSIVLKQLGSIPLAGVWLDFKNLPSVGQIRKIDRDLIGKYTQELEWRTMGYSTPETKQLKENPNWTQRNKTVQFALGGGAITAMDGWAASVLWPWAENKVRRENPELEIGTQEEIENGSSKFYKKVAEVFNEAVARSQSTSDEMHQGTLRKSKNPVTRAFTMFKSDASQTYNAWRQTAGEARYYRQSGDETASRKAKHRVGIAFLAATGGYLWAQGIAFLMNLWKHKGKAYRNDDGELTFGSVAEEMALGLVGDLAGVVAGGEEAADILGNILTGEKWYGIDTPGMEQMNDVIETIITQSKGAFAGLKNMADIVANDGDLGEYLHRNAGDITGGMKELAETIATYVPGISVNNLEAYLLGTVKWASPELATAYEDALQTSTKGDLKGLTGDALAQRVDSIFSIRRVELDANAADAVAALYEAGFTGAVPVDTPSSLNVGDESRELGAYQKQVYDKVWSNTVNDTMQELLASDEFAEASDAAKEKMLKALYSYAGEQAKAVLFEDYTADTAKADAVLNAGASMTEWLTWVGQSGTLEPETGKESVSATQKYKLLRGMDYSDKVKFAIAGSVMGTEMKTENGTKSQYAKMLDIQKGGLSADQYLNLRIEGAVDKYLKQKEAGASNSTAYQMAMALDKMPEETKPVEKWRTAIKTGGSQKEQLAALKGVMTEVQYDKVEIATYYNIKPDTWVKLNEMMPEFDEDGNGSYKKGEIENAIDALGDRDNSLASAQKAALWQLMTGSTSAKNNPYNTVVAQEIIDERSKRKADREESKKKTK